MSISECRVNCYHEQPSKKCRGSSLEESNVKFLLLASSQVLLSKNGFFFHFINFNNAKCRILNQFHFFIISTKQKRIIFND